MRIIITAFEPFGGFTLNSSYECLKKLNDDSIIKIILPVSYPDAYLTLKPYIKSSDFIILLGMAAKRSLISIEERAKNILSFKIPDNKGNTITNKLIDNNAPEYIYSKVNIDNLINYLNNKQEICYKSSDAGEYICNYLYFEVLKNHQNPSIFIHIPNYQTDKDFDILNDFLRNLINYIKN